MLDRTLKSLMAVLILAGTLAGQSAATSRVAQRFSTISAPSAARPAGSAAHRRLRALREEEGCRELPTAPVSAPVAVCS